MSALTIGSKFTVRARVWRVTGLVQRGADAPPTAVTAVCESEHPDDQSWHLAGPPYAVVEHVWDEEGLQGVEWLEGTQ
jgi:hypothetical protein